MSRRQEDQISEIFAALSDPTRRAIMARLRTEEASVTELAEPFDISLPAISKHLRTLEKAGLVQRRRDGRVHLISLAGDSFKFVVDWLETYRIFRADELEKSGEEAEQSA